MSIIQLSFCSSINTNAFIHVDCSIVSIQESITQIMTNLWQVNDKNNNNNNSDNDDDNNK